MEAYNWHVNFQLKENISFCLVYLSKPPSLSRKHDGIRVSNDLQIKLNNPLHCGETCRFIGEEADTYKVTAKDFFWFQYSFDG